jgi:hypothetical protein
VAPKAVCVAIFLSRGESSRNERDIFPESGPSAGRDGDNSLDGAARDIGVNTRLLAPAIAEALAGLMFSALLDLGGENISISVRSMSGDSERLSNRLIMGDVERPTSYWPSSTISGELPRLYPPNGDLDLLSTRSLEGERERERRL